MVQHVSEADLRFCPQPASGNLCGREKGWAEEDVGVSQASQAPCPSGSPNKLQFKLAIRSAMLQSNGL